MKKRRIKKSIKKALIILFIYLIGIVFVLLMVQNAENYNRIHDTNKIQVNN